MRLERIPVFAATLLVLGLLWAALAVWQGYEYQRDCRSARDTLHRQAESIYNALVGGIRSHRRLGFFFDEQVEAALEELAKSEDVLAVAVTSQDGKVVVSAGNPKLLDTSAPARPGEYWEPSGYLFVGEFTLEPEPPGGPPGAGHGGGPGGGGGWGRGWGRMMRSQQEEPGRPSPFAAGGQFTTQLLLKRADSDAACLRAAWTRGLVVAAGGLMLVCVAAAWMATLWWIDARGRAQVLEAEARHLRDLGQAAAGLAHETRNPLGLIRGWAQRVAGAELPPGDQQGQAQAVVEECDRITSRINQFLAFARPCEPRREPIDPDQVVRELAVLVEPDLDAQGLRLLHVPAQPAATIRADKDLLRQALFNLVRNAIQFSPPAAEVEIRVGRGEDGGCRLEVADRGPGVPPEKVPMLFTPYFTTRAQGTGLGLAVVGRIAAAHGWKAGYGPRPGGGAIFWLDRLHG